MTSWGNFVAGQSGEDTVHRGESVIIYCFEAFNNKSFIPCVEVSIYPYKKLAFACDSDLEPRDILTEQARTPTPTHLQKDETATPSPSIVFYRVAHVASNDVLNIREGAGIKYKIIATIPPTGIGIQITGDGVQANSATWVPIIYNGITGWVNSYYLTRQ
jgi:uncharacterized protein YgiM (DUF1202 family)